MSFNNGIYPLLSDTSITALVVFLLYRIVMKLIEKIPQSQ